MACDSNNSSKTALARLLRGAQGRQSLSIARADGATTAECPGLPLCPPPAAAQAIFFSVSEKSKAEAERSVKLLFLTERGGGTKSQHPMFFIVSLIALALVIAIAASSWAPTPPEGGQDGHLVVLTVFASPTIAAVYGGLTLIVCNVMSRVGLARTVLPWWPQRRGRAAVTITRHHRRVVGWVHRSYSVGMVVYATLTPKLRRRGAWAHLKN